MLQSFDQLVKDSFGDLGRFQWLIFLLMTFVYNVPLIRFPQLAYLTPQHSCAQPWLENIGWTRSQIINVTVPTVNANASDHKQFEQCLQYNISDADLISNSSLKLSPDLEVISCQHGWSYDQASYFKDSFTKSFDLVCERKYFIPMTTLSYMVGMGIGSLIGGRLGDKYGRLKVATASTLLNFLSSVLTSLSPNIWMFTVLRVLVGMFSISAVVNFYVFCCEFTSARHRNTFNFCFHFVTDGISNSLLVLEAYLIQDWRILHTVCALPAVISLLLYKFIPESPSWFIEMGRNGEAREVFAFVAKFNGKSEEKALDLFDRNFPESVPLQEKSEEDGNCIKRKSGKNTDSDWYDIITAASMKQTTIVLSILWFFFVMNVYGLLYYCVRLKGNPYLIAFISGVIFVPACMIKYIIYAHFDRKTPLFVFYFIACLSCCLTVMFQVIGHSISSVIFSSVAIFSASTIMMMFFNLTPELYPTRYRTSATGFVSAVGRFGSIAGMFVERLDEFMWPALPMVLFATGFGLSGFALFFLPVSSQQAMNDHFMVNDGKEHSKIDVGENTQ